MQVHMQGHITHYTKKRYAFYFILSLFIFILPFIKINDNHFFLLSFDHKKLHLFFIAFNTQEFYLLPFVLILLFLTIFFITTLAGRIWCAWSCPQTIFRVIYRDFIQTKLLKIRKNIRNKQKEYPGNLLKKTLAVLLFYAICLVAVSNLLWYFVPPEDFFSYLQNPAEHKLLLGILLCASLFLCFDITYLAEKFCIFVCPYARIQSVMFDNDTMQVIYDERRGGVIYEHHTKLHKRPPQGECTGCEACVSVCPTHIDIRKGMQLECINCLECADACSSVQDKLGRPSLISWSSSAAVQSGGRVRYFRFRTVAYCVVLCIALAALFVMGARKEGVLVNINRSSELYDLRNKSGELEITNAYTFLVENTDNEAHTYYFEIQARGEKDGISILRPRAPFRLEAGAKAKKIVVLKAEKALANDHEKDSIIPLRVKIYALDDEGIVALRKSIFVYPRASILQEK